MAERRKCPWCDGEALIAEERKSVGHSVPVCEGFTAALRIVPRADRVTIDVVDDAGELQASFPKR